MKILVLNSGSSSLKYQVIDTETGEMLVKGNYERIGGKRSCLRLNVRGEKSEKEKAARNYEEAINQYISSAGTMLSKITDAESGSDIDIEGISQICISIVRPARII